MGITSIHPRARQQLWPHFSSTTFTAAVSLRGSEVVCHPQLGSPDPISHGKHGQGAEQLLCHLPGQLGGGQLCTAMAALLLLSVPPVVGWEQA